MFTTLKKYISPDQKKKLKPIYYKTKKRIIDIAFSYSYAELLKALRDLGISPGDALMVHSSANYFSGFKGTPHEIIKALKEVIGPDQGTLLMVSLPYTGSTFEYLQKTKTFNVKRTAGKMGLIPEIFRRQKDVVRSLHPTHPVLAYGPLANWFIQGHENCLYPCGPESPFEKLFQKDGKVLFFDVPFNTFTFIHYIEHIIKENLPFLLYDKEIFEVKVIDTKGDEIPVKAMAFSPEAVQKRRPDILENELLAGKKLIKRRIGMTDLSLVNVKDAVFCANKMAENETLFYDFS